VKLESVNIIRFESIETYFNTNGLARAFAETVSTRVWIANYPARPVQQIDGVAGTIPYGSLRHKSSAIRKRTRTMWRLEILW